MASGFDRYDKTYESTVEKSIAFSGLEHGFFIDAKVRLLQRLFERHFGNRKPVLADIGCGVGVMHARLLDLCSSIVAVDPSAECIERARARQPSIRYERSDGQSLPWPDGHADVALAVCVFHHIAPADRPDVLREMRRVVRPGGLVAIIEHNPWNPACRLAIARCPFDDDAVLLDWREARRLFRSAGMYGSAEHFLLLPFAGQVAQKIERTAARLPVGAQYLMVGSVPGPE